MDKLHCDHGITALHLLVGKFWLLSSIGQNVSINLSIVANHSIQHLIIKNLHVWLLILASVDFQLIPNLVDI